MISSALKKKCIKLQQTKKYKTHITEDLLSSTLYTAHTLHIHYLHIHYFVALKCLSVGLESDNQKGQHMCVYVCVNVGGYMSV